MFGVDANDTDNTVPFDNLAFIAYGLYAGSYFHKIPLGSVYRDPALAHLNDIQPDIFPLNTIFLFLSTGEPENLRSPQISLPDYKFLERSRPFFTSPS